MRDLEDVKKPTPSSAERATEKVDLQKRIVAQMMSGDPSLPFARALLGQMELSAALAKVAEVLVDEQTESPGRSSASKRPTA